MTGTIAVLDDRSVAALIPRRDPRSHKGSHGTLVAVCGSLDYAGAALLVAMSAARAGAGLVCLAVPASLQAVVAGRVPEATTLGLPEADSGGLDPDAALERIIERAPDALVVGPGLVGGRGTASLVRALTATAGGPLLLDAQAVNEMAGSTDWSVGARRPLVVTPHPVEFARLDGSPVGGGDDERATRAAEAARRWDCVVVLKGAGTVVASPDGRIARAPFANAALATAGSGDVLSGTIGALLAQGLEPYDAARSGVYLHGAAAEALAARVGDAGLLASDLPHAIALTRRDLAAVRDTLAGERRLGFGERDRA